MEKLNGEQISIICVALDARILACESNISVAAQVSEQCAQYWQHEAEKARALIAFFRSHF